MSVTLNRVIVFAKTGKLFLDGRFVYKTPVFDVSGKMSIGKRFVTYGRLVSCNLSVGKNGSLVVGDDVFINQGTRIHSEQSIIIGSRTEIGDFACIYDTNFHSVEPFGDVKIAAVSIGDDCWIGSAAMVLPGVTLGRGCVVAGGAVVTHSFPEGTLLAGNPARAVKSFPVPKEFRRRGREKTK